MYIILDDNVYDVPSFAEMHPGGENLLIDFAGLDATEAFEDVGHTNEAREILESLNIGRRV